jgi:hypothetical protein
MTVWGVLYGVVAPFASVITRSCVDGPAWLSHGGTTKKETGPAGQCHMPDGLCGMGETPTVDLLGGGKVLLGCQRSMSFRSP